MRPRISAVIGCSHEARHLDRCLDSIQVSGYPRDSLEVIVVNSSSNTQSTQVARKRGAVVVKSTGTLPELLNDGARAALGDILVFVSPESEVEVGWFERALDVLTDGCAAWVASGKMAIRRTPFERVGTFHSSLDCPADLDICRRLNLAGHQVAVDRRSSGAA